VNDVVDSVWEWCCR